MKTWVKLYTKGLDSPDTGSLSWAHRGIFDALLQLAGRLDHKDGGKETGQLDELERTAWRIRCELSEFTEAIAAFTERGMIDERDGVLYVTNYAKHHRRSPSDSPEAVAERVQRHRARKAEESNEAVTDCNEAVTSAKRPETALEQSRAEESRADAEESRADAAAEAETERAETTRDAAAVSENGKKALQSLLDLGISAPMAQELSQEHPSAHVIAWCSEIKKRGKKVNNPPGLAISMLEQGISPPKPSESKWYTPQEYEQHVAELEPG